MNFINPLLPVYEAAAVADDCFKVAMRTVEIQRKELIGRTQLGRADPAEAKAALEGAERQAADLAILALFATFERFVIEHLQAANCLLAAGHPQQYASKLAEKFESEVEFWRFGEILNLFKGEVDADLIGRVKQIKQYRDWIAHQNPARAASAQVTPKTAFDVLTSMIKQIRLTHTLPRKQQLVETVEAA
jgi:hypothetical protein